MVWKVRRVVTGHGKEGKSILLMDGHAPNVMEMASMPGLALTDLWETTGAPANNAGDAGAAARPVRLEPPRAGRSSASSNSRPTPLGATAAPMRARPSIRSRPATRPITPPPIP